MRRGSLGSKSFGRVLSHGKLSVDHFGHKAAYARSTEYRATARAPERKKHSHFSLSLFSLFFSNDKLFFCGEKLS